MAVRLTAGHAVANSGEAAREARAVAQVVRGWKEHFAACGVASTDIELYAEQIDRPFLREQREEAIAEARRC